MKISVLAVSGTLLSISLLIGQSYSFTRYRFNADDSNGGATLAEKSSRWDLSRDMSHPINARFARSADDRDGDPSPSPKFNHLILIIPCVLGVVLIIFIAVVVCYQMRKSGRNRCISNEWLIWCGLKKREHSPDPSDAGIDRSIRYSSVVCVGEKGIVETQCYAPSAASPRYSRGDESASSLLSNDHGIRTSAWETEEKLGACPSEKSPTRQDTPNTDVTPLPTDDEEMSPRTEVVVHHYDTDPSGTKFKYPDPHVQLHEGSITFRQTRANHKGGLENIPENENINKGLFAGGRSKTTGTRCGNGESGSDDDVFKDEADKQNISSEDAGTSARSCDPGRKRKEAFASSRDSSMESNHSQGEAKISGEGSGGLPSSTYEPEEPQDLHNKSIQSIPMHGGKQHVYRDASDRKPLMTGEQTGMKESPSSAPPLDNHGEIHGGEVYLIVHGDAHFDFKRTVTSVQVGNREVNNNYHHHFHQVVPNEVNNSFNRASRVRHTR